MKVKSYVMPYVQFITGMGALSMVKVCKNYLTFVLKKLSFTHCIEVIPGITRQVNRQFSLVLHEQVFVNDYK